MSGCFSSSSAGRADHEQQRLRQAVERLRTRFGRAASSCAAYSTSDTFSSSEGWNCSGPAPSQRVAPFTVTPMPGSITAHVSANEPTSSSGVSALDDLQPVPRGEVQHAPARASPNIT